MNDIQLEAAIRAYAGERGYRPATIDRWLALSTDDAAALWDLIGTLHLGENQARDLWEWSEEIAARDGVTIAAVLTREAVHSAVHGSGGRNDRMRAVKACIRRFRFPALVSVQERLEVLIAGLGLPRDVKVSVPEFLEGDELRVEIVARDAQSLQDAANQVAAAASTPACEAIFELLSEAPDSQ